MRRHPNNYDDFLLSDDEYIVRLGKKHYDRPKRRHWQAEAYVDEFDEIDNYDDNYDDEYAHDFRDEDYFEFVDDEDEPEN